MNQSPMTVGVIFDNGTKGITLEKAMNLYHAGVSMVVHDNNSIVFEIEKKPRNGNFEGLYKGNIFKSLYHEQGLCTNETSN